MDMNKVKVLFISANPVGTTKLQLDEEIRQIMTKIRASEYRDALELVPRFATRPDDFLRECAWHAGRGLPSYTVRRGPERPR